MIVENIIPLWHGISINMYFIRLTHISWNKFHAAHDGYMFLSRLQSFQLNVSDNKFREWIPRTTIKSPIE